VATARKHFLLRDSSVGDGCSHSTFNIVIHRQILLSIGMGSACHHHSEDSAS